MKTCELHGDYETDECLACARIRHYRAQRLYEQLTSKPIFDHTPGLWEISSMLVWGVGGKRR